jgi:enoyl-CoA hydratase/carnithine racemase
MYGAITQALIAGEADAAVTAHLIHGSGGVFTAGNDLADFRTAAEGDRATLAGVLAFLDTLPKVQKPMIAAVDGIASGIGTTLLFHCDLVYATPAATFSTPFLDLGLVPENGSSLLAPLIMGHQRAFELLVLGETFTAERAVAAGFVNRLVSPEHLEATARGAALRLATKPPEALAIARRLLRSDAGAIAARSREEAELFGQRLQSAEAREAISAFLEKRKPDCAIRRP